MSSTQLTTQIIVVESDVEECQKDSDILENDSFDAQFSSASSSDEDLDDNRYDNISEDTTLPEESLKKIGDLYIKNHFNKLEIIQKTSDKNEVNPQMVSHLVLSDNKPKEDVIDNDLIDENSKFIFRNKLKILKEIEIKSKEEIERQNSVKSDVQINTIPQTFEQFLKIIFDLNADLIKDENSKLFFREETHNRDIRFQSHESYINSFIPFVIREFWSALKTSRKRDVISYDMSFHKFESENEINCSHIRNKSCDKSVFKFGQIVVIKYPLIEESEQNQTYFGVVIGVSTKLIDKTSPHLSHSLFQNLTESEENDFICETVVIYCNPLVQNVESVSIIPLICVQKYLLEARIVYELKDAKNEKIFQQILKPNFKYGISGLSVNLEERKDLFDIQKDAIQKAYDMCCLPEMEDFSSFLAIYGGPKTGKSEILNETALQLLKSAEEKIEKLIIITTGITKLVDIIDNLKKNGIKVFHVDSDGSCLSHKNSDLRRIVKKLNKMNRFDDIEGKEYSFDQCLKFYGQEIKFSDLSVRDQYVKEMIDKRVSQHLLSESQAIIGSIESIMNDESFNRIFNMSSDNNIKSVLIDDAHLLTETELLTLLFAGVRRFVLFGDNHQNPNSFEKCESFLRRYVRLYLKNINTNDSKNYSILFLRETIDSLKRYQINSNQQNNRQNNRNNNFRNRNRFGYSGNQRLIQYSQSSSYGSEFFKNKYDKYDRFKDRKPFKTETKFDINPNTSTPNSYLMSEQNVREGSQPNQSRAPENQMISGIASNFGFGTQNSYISPIHNQNNFGSRSFTESNSSLNGMLSANSDPNANNFLQNESQFVSNPTRHQNYNLF